MRAYLLQEHIALSLAPEKPEDLDLDAASRPGNEMAEKKSEQARKTLNPRSSICKGVNAKELLVFSDFSNVYFSSSACATVQV